jgi:hypothetical protein
MRESETIDSVCNFRTPSAAESKQPGKTGDSYVEGKYVVTAGGSGMEGAVAATSGDR